MLAQHEDEGGLDGEEGVAHPDAVARPLPEHEQTKLVGCVLRRKVLRIKNGRILEVLPVPNYKVVV